MSKFDKVIFFRGEVQWGDDEVRRSVVVPDPRRYLGNTVFESDNSTWSLVLYVPSDQSGDLVSSKEVCGYFAADKVTLDAYRLPDRLILTRGPFKKIGTLNIYQYGYGRPPI